MAHAWLSRVLSAGAVCPLPFSVTLRVSMCLILAGAPGKFKCPYATESSCPSHSRPMSVGDNHPKAFAGAEAVQTFCSF